MSKKFAFKQNELMSNEERSRVSGLLDKLRELARDNGIAGGPEIYSQWNDTFDALWDILDKYPQETDVIDLITKIRQYNTRAIKAFDAAIQAIHDIDGVLAVWRES